MENSLGLFDNESRKNEDTFSVGKFIGWESIKTTQKISYYESKSLPENFKNGWKQELFLVNLRHLD